MTKKTKTKENRKMGRPVSVQGRDYRVYLDPESVQKARDLGQGNLSAGIRIALSRARE